MMYYEKVDLSCALRHSFEMQPLLDQQLVQHDSCPFQTKLASPFLHAYLVRKLRNTFYLLTASLSVSAFVFYEVST